MCHLHRQWTKTGLSLFLPVFALQRLNKLIIPDMEKKRGEAEVLMQSDESKGNAIFTSAL